MPDDGHAAPAVPARALAEAYAELLRARDPEPLITRMLSLLCALTGARSGYVELRARDSDHRWHAHSGLSHEDVETVRDRISTAIVSSALEAGETIHIPSAVLDPRFRDRESVRAGEIEAVLCVPLRADEVDGVVYLQNSRGGGAFSNEHVHRVEIAAHFVAQVAGRLVDLQRRRVGIDPVVQLRERLGALEIVGSSPALASVLKRIEVVAPMSVNVLIEGPTGSGKSMLARVLHDNSHRASGPFVELNCATLPESLFESELFGADRGAHSGVASRGQPGKIEAAAGGTLFLDEVGELSLGAQAKLLQVLQSRQFYRLGGTKPVSADVRFVSATNRDLEAEVKARTFRDDLYYRLRGVGLVVPPLEERRTDIPALAERFTAEACQANGLPEMELSFEAMAALEFAEWPGQIRELASRCQEAVINARLEGTQRIEVHHVFREGPPALASGAQSLQEATARFQAMYLREALNARDWNVSKTARDLDMSRSHLHELMKRHGLARDTVRGGGQSEE